MIELIVWIFQYRQATMRTHHFMASIHQCISYFAHEVHMAVGELRIQDQDFVRIAKTSEYYKEK